MKNSCPNAAFFLSISLAMLVGACGELWAQQPSDFAHEVVPILNKHCIACHGGREAKGSFSMNNRELFVDSGHVVSGKPEESHFLALVESTDKEIQMPPADRPRLDTNEIAILRKWIADDLPWEDAFSFAPVAYEPPLKPRRPELPAAVDGRTNPIDRILDADMAKHQIRRPKPIDDATFLRRAHLDLVGLLPKPEALAAFVADPSSDKRDRMIRQLLDDKIAYADHWLTFFNDLLRNDYSGTGFITGGRAQVTTWLYEALLTNKPYDQFAHELIAPPSDGSQGYIDGIRWRGEVSAGQTVEIQFAQSVSQSFLGINMKCASCHDSFIDRWKLEESYGLAAIYSSRPLEIHRCDKPVGKQAEAKWLFPELGQIDAAAPREERLKQLAALMTHPDNGRFTRNIVNRLWYRLMGRGIVHPLDAMQSEPWNSDLLDQLAIHLSDNHFNLKSVLYLIATSNAYQSQCLSRATEIGEKGATSYVFKGPVARRLMAEQFVDSVWQITKAAPTTFDAVVVRGVANANEVAKLQLQGKWIWGDSAANSQIPPSGETIILQKEFTLPDDVTSGGAIVTCDNGFKLFVNGHQVKKSSEWEKPRGFSLAAHMTKGTNAIIAVATNAGAGPNAAGFFFESRMTLTNGETISVVSDDSWQWNPSKLKPNDETIGRIDGLWKPVTIVPALPVWTAAVESTGRELLVQSMNGDLRMTRASLLKSDFLMRSLGRPLREQIVSMRPSELTTLEAIDLSNGATLSSYLAVGGKQLSETWANDRAGLISYLYQFALARNPSSDEIALLTDSLSSQPTALEIEDVLWTIFMTPEFLLIR